MGVGVGEAVLGTLGVGGGGAAVGVEINRLRAQVLDLEKQLKVAKEERDGSLVGGVEDVQKLKSKLRVAEMATQRAQERLSILGTIDKKAESLEKELREKEEELTRLVKGRDEWENAVKEQLEEMRNGKVEAEGKASEASEKLIEVTGKLKSAEEEKGVMFTKLTLHLKTKKDLEEANANLAGEKMDLVHRLGETEDSLSRAQERVDYLEKELQKFGEDSGMAVTLKAELDAKVGGFAQEKQSLEKQVRILEEQKRLLESRVQELELQLSAVTEEFEQVRGGGGGGGFQTGDSMELEALKAESKAAARRVQELEAQVRVLREEKEGVRIAALKESVAETEDLQGWREGLAQRLEEAVAVKNKALARVEELESELVEATTRIGVASAAKREAETRVLGLEGAIAKLQVEVQEAQAGRRSALEKVGGLEGQLAMLMGNEAGHVATREELEKTVSRLKREVGSHVERYRQMEAKIAELETAKMGLDDKVRMLLEEQTKVTMRKRELETQLAEAKEASAERGDEIKAQQEIFTEQMERLKIEREGLVFRALEAEEFAKRAHDERLTVTERLHEEIQKLTEQLASGAGAEGSGAQALMEATELRSQIGTMADKTRQTERALEQARNEWTKASREAEEKGQLLEKERYIAKQRELGLTAELDEVKRAVTSVKTVEREVEKLRSEKQYLSVSLEEAQSLNQSLASLNAALEAERLSLQDKQGGLQERNRQLEQVKAQLVLVTSERKSLEEQKISLAARLNEAELSLAAVEEMRLRNALLEGERETLAARAEEGERLREENATLTKQFVQLQSKLDSVLSGGDQKKTEKSEHITARAAAVIVEEAAQLRMRNTELKRKVAVQRTELDALKGELGQQGLTRNSPSGGLVNSPVAIGRVGGKIGGMMSPKEKDANKQVEELRRKMVALEGELQRKAEALAFAEKRLGERGLETEDVMFTPGGGGGSILKSPSPRSSRVGPMSPLPNRDSKEILKLQDKIRSMESEVKQKEAREKDSEERERALQQRLEILQGGGQRLSETEEEVLLLRSQLASFSQKEKELSSKIKEQEGFQAEMKRLQQAHAKLEKKLSQQQSGAVSGNLQDRVAVLETELAEALENNNMYKEQLKTAFADKANVDSAAMSSLGDADSVINEILEYKRRSKTAEKELAKEKEKYNDLSVRYSEVEAQRQELVTVLKSSRNGLKM